MYYWSCWLFPVARCLYFKSFTVKSTELILWVATCIFIFRVRMESRYFLFSSLGDLERDSERYYQILAIELKHCLYFSSQPSSSIALNGLFAFSKAVDLCFIFFIVLAYFEPPLSNYVVLEEKALHAQHEFI